MVTISQSPFILRKKLVPVFLTKDLSAFDVLRGGALIPPPAQGRTISIFRNRSRKKMLVPEIKGSYFGDCERDKEGRCVKKGQAGERAQQEPTTQQQPAQPQQQSPQGKVEGVTPGIITEGKPEGETRQEEPKTPMQEWSERDEARYNSRVALESAVESSQNVQLLQEADESLQILHADLESGNTTVPEMKEALDEALSWQKAYWDNTMASLKEAGVNDKGLLSIQRILHRGEATIRKAVEGYQAQAERAAHLITQLEEIQEQEPQEPEPDDPAAATWESQYNKWFSVMEKLESKVEKEREKFTEKYESLAETIGNIHEKADDEMQQVIEIASSKIDEEEERDPEPEEEFEVEEEFEGSIEPPAIEPSPFRDRTR